MPKPPVSVCGVPLRSGVFAVSMHGDGKVHSHWNLSKPDARRLVQGVHGAAAKMPRPGKGVRLCGALALYNMSGSYQIERLDGGNTLEGARRRRR